MKFTFYGHSCFSVEVSGKTLLFDPFITGNELAAGIVNADTIKADYILQSHAHGDHLADLISIAKRTGAQVIAMAEVAGWVNAQGHDNAHPMNYGSREFEFGRVSMVPAWHSSSFPDGSYGGNPAGFVVKTAAGSFYFAGDTCLMTDMKLIPHYAKPDFIILPIGGNFTMDADDAVVASDFVGCNRVIGVHFDTFGYIKIDKEAAKSKFAAAGKELILPEIGKTIEL